MTLDGSGEFKIINKLGRDISDIRLSHFIKGDDFARYAQVESITELKNNQSKGPFTFVSNNGKNDHWSIAFKDSNGCWSSFDLKWSMSKDYDPEKYKVVLDDFGFWVGGEWKTSEVYLVHNTS